MKKRILAVCSSGGHWEQMMLLRDSFKGHQVTYVTTKEGLAERSNISDFHLVGDCNRDTYASVIRTTLELFRIINAVRPNVVFSTGAAPGILAILIGRMFGAKTIWLDSIANYERLSMSGQIAGYVAHVQITQWPHLSRPGGPIYAGSLL